MSFGKWSFGSRNRSTASSGKSDMSTSSSSTTRTSSPNNRGSGGGSSSNRNSKTSSSSSTSSSSRLSWFRSSNRPPKRRSIISRDDPAFARLHKPFTPQNLEHQKMLSTFEWTFDDHMDCKRRRTSLSLSPCASRNTTVDDYAPDCCGYGYGDQETSQHSSHDHALPPNGRQNTLSGPFANLSMRDGSGEDLDLENAS
ncbi:hypothetical protein F4860DRAFT_283243 [Xylaria cubensis]|nr:hypothetical protein F4860DRAFT_283243 [Xylaria cubensis]